MFIRPAWQPGRQRVVSEPSDPQAAGPEAQPVFSCRKQRWWQALGWSNTVQCGFSVRSEIQDLSLSVLHRHEVLLRVRFPPRTALGPSGTAPRGTAGRLFARSAPTHMALRCLPPSQISAAFSLAEAVQPALVLFLCVLAFSKRQFRPLLGLRAFAE